MSSSEIVPFDKKNLTHHKSATSFRWILRSRRQRLPSVRLGDKKKRRGPFLVRLCRKAKLKWLRVKYLCMIKKLRKYNDSLVNDLLDGKGTIESYQQRMLLEASCAVPAMGFGLYNFS